MVPAQHALAVYAESLVADRRVAVVGDASLGLGGRLLELGARAVVLWDPDEDRAAQEAERAPAGVIVRALPLDDAEVRPGAVDLALVPDLAFFDDPQGVLALVRRVVGDEGVAVVAAGNRDAAPAEAPAFDYYELFDLVAGAFEDVRMVAQVPFAGVALAELGREDEPSSVSVDTQLAEGGRVPEAFIAVASSGGVSLEPYCIVELPGRGPAPDAEDRAEGDREAEAQLAEAQLRAQALLGQLDETRARLHEVERASTAVLTQQGEQLLERSARVAELERTLAERAAQLAELSIEVEERRSAAEAGRVAASQIEELARRADRAERALAALEPELSRVGEAHALEHARFEEALRDRAQAIRQLEAEVARRDRMVRELVDALEEGAARPPPVAAEEARSVAPAQPPEPVPQAPATLPGEDELARENVNLRQRLDTLALELARREGEAQAAAWSVAELERRVAQAERLVSPPAPRAGKESEPAEGELAAVLDELDMLRQAFAQEHAQRLRAESGEELVQARAEIRRQAALLEELGHRDQGGAGAGSGAAGGVTGASGDVHPSGK